MTRLFAALSFLLVLTAPACAAEDDHPRPYDRNFNAMAEVDAALAQGLAENKRVLLLLGANWCHDSRGLAHHFEDEEVAATLEAHYVLRHIDVGWRDQNQDVMRRFGIAAIYGTPTVFIIDPASERLLNREERSAWTSADSRPVEEVREYFARWASADGESSGLVESSLVYQSMLIEIELFEDAEGDRLAAAYREVGAWYDMDAADRPADFDALEGEVERWRRAVPRQVRDLKADARRMVSASLAELAGDGPITPNTVAQLDAQDPDLPLDFQPHSSDRW